MEAETENIPSIEKMFCNPDIYDFQSESDEDGFVIGNVSSFYQDVQAGPSTEGPVPALPAFNIAEEAGYECDKEDSGDEIYMSAKKKKVSQRGRPVGSKKRKRAVSDDEDEDATVKRQKKSKVPLQSIIAVLCCASLCLSKVPMDAVLSLREHVAPLNINELSQWVLEWLWTHPSSSDSEFCFLIGQWKVCLTAFLTVIGMPLSTYYTIRKRYKAGQRVISRQGGNSRATSKSQTALLWLQDYAQKYAEKMPDQNKLLLPPCLTRSSIYSMYIEEMDIMESETISMSHFYWLWRNCMSYVTIPKRSRFSKCNKCCEIKTKLSETKDKLERQKLIQERQEHLLKQGLERRKYHKHATKARIYPQKYVSVIIDGMDQSKTDIPHFLFNSSLAAGMWKLRTHLIGAIAHGIGKFGFFDFYQYPHSSNLTIHALLMILSRLPRIPGVLYLQLDNCARENKNRYLLGLLCLLVEKKVFRKVKMSFLMVGHTHEDVDQVFSRFSVWLRKHTASTLPKLLEAWEKCTTPSPLAFLTEAVLGVTEWLSDFIHPISGHSKPHTFKISLDSTGKAEIQFKDWANDKTWKQTSGKERHLLKGIQPTKPVLLRPSTHRIDVERLQGDVNKVIPIFDRQAKSWWDNFFTKLESLSEDGAVVAPELNIIDKILDIKEQQRLLEHDNADVSTISTESNLELPDSANEKNGRARSLQVTIGKAKKEKDNELRIQKGMLALLDVPHYAGEWPQMARIQSIDGENVLVHWYKGSKTTAWQPCTKRSVNGGKWVPWTEHVDKKFIWYFGFELTGAGKLPQNIKEKLESYDWF